MGDDDIGHESGEPVDGGFFIFVDVDDHVGRRKRAHGLDVDALGAPYFRDRPDAILWMNAETGPAYEPVPRAELEQKLGDAGHEADDACIAARGRVRSPDGIDCAGSILLHDPVRLYAKQIAAVRSA